MNAHSAHQTTPGRGAPVGERHAARSCEQSRWGWGTGRNAAGEQRENAGMGRGGEGRLSIGRDTRPAKGSPRRPCLPQPYRAAPHLPGAGHRRAVHLQSAHAAPAAAPCAQPGRGEARRAGARRHRPACDCSDQWGRRARACGAATSTGPARSCRRYRSEPCEHRTIATPSRRHTGLLCTSGAEQLYFILKIFGTNKWVRQTLV